MSYSINVFNSSEYSQKVAHAISALIKKTQPLKFSLVISGGSTPKVIFEVLAEDKTIPWDSVHIFWSDERYVPHTDSESNFYMAYNFLIKNISIPGENIHPISTDFSDSSEAAQQYEKEINEFFKGSVQFDLNLLGLGEDCHTASLFPHFKQLNEKSKLVLPVVDSPKPPSTRITLTYPALNSAKHTFFLVTGKGKAEAVKRVIKGTEKTFDCPAKGITSLEGPLWWLDTESAALVI